MKLILNIEESKCILLISSLYYKRVQSFICGGVTGSSGLILLVWKPALKCHPTLTGQSIKPGKSRLTILFKRVKDRKYK